MTNREFLTAIINIENIAEDIKAEAEAKLAKLDATNEARKNKPSKKATTPRRSMYTSRKPMKYRKSFAHSENVSRPDTDTSTAPSKMWTRCACTFFFSSKHISVQTAMRG